MAASFVGLSLELATGTGTGSSLTAVLRIFVFGLEWRMTSRISEFFFRMPDKRAASEDSKRSNCGSRSVSGKDGSRMEDSLFERL